MILSGLYCTVWNKAFQEYMESTGFKQSAANPCVYVQVAGMMTIVAVYVDDLILNTKTTEEMKESLMTRFKMKDMGKLHYCLGIGIEQVEDWKCLWLH